MSADEVYLANLAFYTAFRDRDLDALEAMWASEAEVACIHPGWPVLEGREAVLDSWRRILSSPDAPEIHCADAAVHLLGPVAWVTCREVLDGGHLVATNIFVREHGAWRIVHHQAGPLPGAPAPVADEEWN